MNRTFLSVDGQPQRFGPPAKVIVGGEKDGVCFQGQGQEQCIRMIDFIGIALFAAMRIGFEMHSLSDGESACNPGVFLDMAFVRQPWRGYGSPALRDFPQERNIDFRRDKQGAQLLNGPFRRGYRYNDDAFQVSPLPRPLDPQNILLHHQRIAVKREILPSRE